MELSPTSSSSFYYYYFCVHVRLRKKILFYAKHKYEAKSHMGNAFN